MIYKHKTINQEVELEKDKIVNKNKEFFEENFNSLVEQNKRQLRL